MTNSENLSQQLKTLRLEHLCAMYSKEHYMSIATFYNEQIETQKKLILYS